VARAGQSWPCRLVRAGGRPAPTWPALTLARAAAARVDRDSDRDQALNQSRRHGRGTATRHVRWRQRGDRRRRPGRRGHARRRAGHREGDAAGWPAALTIINAMTSPIWRAAGWRWRRGEGDAREYFAEVDPPARPGPRRRTRITRPARIIEIALESGDYDVALRAARAVTVRRAEVVGMLATTCRTRRRRRDEVPPPRLRPPGGLPHAACIALPTAIPAQAAALAAAVANLPSYAPRPVTHLPGPQNARRAGRPASS